MEAFKTLIMIVNGFAGLSVILLVLMQHGKGADAGASFASGSGSAQGVFGSAGNSNFLSRSTAIATVIFFATCLALTYISTHSGKSKGFWKCTTDNACTYRSIKCPFLSGWWKVN